MNKIEELIKLINARMGDLEEIKKRVAEEKRHPNDEEMNKTSELLKEIQSLKKELEVEKREAEVRSELSNTMNERIIRPKIDEDDLSKKFPNSLPPKEKRFASFGENLLAVRNYNTSRDARLGWVENQLRATGMSEGIPTDGGFLVQVDFSAALLEKVYEISPILSRVRKFSLGGNFNGIDLPTVNETSRVSSIWGGIIMYWLEEGGTKQPTKPELRKVTLKLKKCAGLAYMTDELLQDATILSDFTQNGFVEALDVETERVIVRGTGAGQPLGILNSGCLISVGKETGQLADTILAENIINIYARMHPRGIKNAIWLISNSILPQLMFLTMPGIPTIPLYMPPTGLAAAPYGTLLGRPVFAIENCSKLGDQGDIIFSDFSQYVMIDKGEPQKATSIHVKFIYDEVAFRIVYRCDGQPTWAAALTPKDNSSTISPFITLDERA